MKTPTRKVNLILLCVSAIFTVITQQISREATWFQALIVDERNHLTTHDNIQSSYNNDRGSDVRIWSNTRNRNDKPTFVIHVGLPKTATSFLQCTLCANWGTTNAILGQDNYEYIGTCPASCGGKGSSEALKHRFEAFFQDGERAQEGFVGPVLHNTTEGHVMNANYQTPVKLSIVIKRRIQKALKQGRNTFIVYEGAHRFPDDHIKKLAEFFKPDWNVKLVVGYRPLYEWLPSKYNSITKNLMTGSWPGQINDRGILMREVLAFDLDNRTENGFSEMVYEIEVKYRKHPTEIVQNNYGIHFENVYIMDSTQIPAAKGDGDRLLEHFFCNVIPRAYETCSAIREGKWNFDVKSNPSVSLSEDILAVAAYRAGLISNDEPAKGDRKIVRTAIQRYFQEKLSPNYAFPQKCWPQEKLDRLEKLSLQLERQLFVDTWTQERQEAHRRGFFKTVASKKFCEIDTHATLQQREWKSFFASFK